jgi:phage virion morphogenesis protein
MSNIISEKTMEQIRRRIDASIRQNFREEGRPEKWKKSIRAKATGGKTLSDTNVLRNSIRTDIGKRQQIISGTGVVYAAVHQFGYSKKNIPARPFLMVQEDDWEYIANKILQGVSDAFGQ